MKRQLLALSTILVMLFLCTVFMNVAKAADEPVKTAITANTVTPNGEPYCDGNVQYQKYTVKATFEGKAEPVELFSWAQKTGKACEGQKARGKSPDKPNAEGLAKAMKEQAAEGKSRNYCGCYYTYYWIGNCLYYDYYDCYWNWCSYAYRCY